LTFWIKAVKQENMPRKFERADQSYAALDLFSERTAIMEDAVPHRMRDSSEKKANIFVFMKLHLRFYGDLLSVF